MNFRDKADRPKAIPPRGGNIPAELKDIPHWVLWKYLWRQEEKKPGMWAKVPCQVNGDFAKSDNPQTWSSFRAVVMEWQNNQNRYDGIGFMLDPATGYVGLDLDVCVARLDGDEFGLTPFAARIVNRLRTYTEISPSGTGLRLICRGSIPGVVKTDPIELYSSVRYLTFTGNLWTPHHDTITEGGAALAEVHAEAVAIREAKRGNGKQPEAQRQPAPSALTMSERLEKAFASKNGAGISALFYGNTAGYVDGDEGNSRADLALCAKLAFWSEGDPGILDAMFRQSSLFRKKWDERRGKYTYGQMTVNEALRNCSEFFGQQSAATRQTSGKASPAPLPVTPEEAERERSAKIFDIGDMAEGIIAWRKERAAQVQVSTGWPELDAIYTPVPASLTIVTGQPNAGKSSWLDCLAVNLTRNHGWKHAIVSFETQPVWLHAAQICSLWSGRPWSENRDGGLSDKEIAELCGLLKGYFIFNAVPGKQRNLEGVLTFVADNIKAHNINSLLFDPWSRLNSPARLQTAMTDFIADGLAHLSEFTQHNKIHTWLVAHPSKPPQEARGRTTEKVLNLYDVSGSAHFFNAADYGLTVHRWNKGEKNDCTEVFVTKVRRGLPGKLGSVYYNYIETDSSYRARPDKPIGHRSYGAD